MFLRALDDGDVSIILSEVVDYFNIFFSKPVQWNKNTLIRERGSWVRIYGVPLHAWIIDFFSNYVSLIVVVCYELMILHWIEIFSNYVSLTTYVEYRFFQIMFSEQINFISLPLLVNDI